MIFGLSNTNNSCYINSVIQILINIKPFRNYFNETDHNDDKILDTFAKITKFYDSNEKTKQIVRPNTFLKAMFEKFHFSPGRQEDSHEFLYCLLDYMHETMKYDVLVNLKSRAKISENLLKCKDAWKKYCTNNYSIITKLFYGQIKSTIVCHCGDKSVSRNPFCGITISSEQDSIESGIKEYLCNDNVETKCEKCNESSEKNIFKNFEIVPDYLIVQVSRFNNNMTKSNNSIEYITDIDLSDNADPEINPNGLKYQLVGNVYHAGQINYGHYLCSVRNDEDNWNIINDDNIMFAESLHKNDFFKKAVYILLYKRIKQN